MGNLYINLLNITLKIRNFLKKFKKNNTDIVFHLAGASHIDRSIQSPRIFRE